MASGEPIDNLTVNSRPLSGVSKLKFGQLSSPNVETRNLHSLSGMAWQNETCLSTVNCPGKKQNMLLILIYSKILRAQTLNQPAAPHPNFNLRSGFKIIRHYNVHPGFQMI